MQKKLGSLLVLLLCSQLISVTLQAQSAYTIDDTLRGTLNKERSWWNVLHYTIYVKPHFAEKKIDGATTIRFSYQAGQRQNKMQIDLQSPLQIDSVFFQQAQLSFTKRGLNSWLVQLPPQKQSGSKKLIRVDSLVIYYSGQPRLAKNPPWDGGWIFTTDKKGRPWMTVACQGLGASVWYPCKDHQSDEPDEGAMLQISVPDSLVAVANGRLQSVSDQKENQKLYTWKVVNPINNYNLVPYIGKYVSWKDQYQSVAGKPLDLTYWVLDYNLEKATPQFNRDAPRMLRAFEYWFGPYPFQEDGYQLVESSHLGMEHQSAIAYGNGFANGYRGRDLSGTGWGKDWDYIIVHESGHEWFANNITTKDIADMWVHEGFTMYSEVLFINYHYGREGADAYCKGVRTRIRNDKPLIGDYGVNNEGSGDMYNKGAGLLHHIREMINNDSLFKNILVGLNTDFRHQTVTSSEVESYFIKKTALPLQPVFDQYLRTTKIPTLEYAQQGQTLRIRLQNCNESFSMPIRVGKGNNLTVMATTAWQSIEVPSGISIKDVSDNYYLLKKEVPSSL
jgi:aminopeptidase N